MKYFALRLCALFFLACLFSTAKAQSKIGYIDIQQLISAMPESSAASIQIESLRKSQNDQSMALSAQFESKASALQKDLSPLDDPARQARENEVKALAKQVQESRMSGQNALLAKIDELRTQALEKAKLAIARVAAEGGYTLVIQVNQNDVFYSNQQDNLLPAVKAKLGIQ